MKTDKIPTPWRATQIREICQGIEYGYTASADTSISSPKFLRITDIQNGRVNWDAVPGCKISGADLESNRLLDGDIVFARTGGTTGKSFLIKDPPIAVFASYLIRLRTRTEVVLPEFLYAFFQSDGYWSQIRAAARGGAQPNVNASLLGSLKLAIPELPEQRVIVEYIREQFKTIEKVRTAATAQMEAIDALPAAKLREVFEHPERERWARREEGQSLAQDAR